MPVSRTRMRPWLEDLINSNAIPGLVWVDKEKKMFSIPWKHAARHGWEVDKDACLFKQWAVHTGKYKQGETMPDPKTWKANFRCAMNSLPDVEEVKHKSVNKGHQAVRVYRMLHLPAKTKVKRSKAKVGKQRNKPLNAEKGSEDMHWKDTPSPAHEQQTQSEEESNSTQENTVDSTQQHDSLGPCEVPEWLTTVELGFHGTNDFSRKFEVSPDHNTDFEDTEDIINICQQLEQDTQWFQSSSTGEGFFSNGLCTDGYSKSSPGSQWSESSSGEELELPLYTDLNARLFTSSLEFNCTARSLLFG